MKPVPEYHKLTNDLFVWHGYNPECKTDCTSTAVRTPEGFVLIDPLRLEEQALERMVGDDKIAAVLVTSDNHLRGSLYERERLDIPLYAPEGAREIPADFWLPDGGSCLGLQAVALPGGAPGETAYHYGRTLIIGDALIHLETLQILPDKYCTDPAQLRRSLPRLKDLSFDVICFAHGLPLTREPEAAVAAAVG